MTACKAADLEDHFRSRPLPELSAVSLVVMNESERYTKEISGPDQKSLFSVRQKSLAGKGKLMYDIHGQRACLTATSVTQGFQMKLREISAGGCLLYFYRRVYLWS